MNEEQKNSRSESMKRHWANPQYRKMALEARHGREPSEFLRCGRLVYSDAYDKRVRCPNDRHRSAKACNSCLDRVKFGSPRHRIKKVLYRWKFNGRKLIVNGVETKVPRNHLFLDISL